MQLLYFKYIVNCTTDGTMTVRFFYQLAYWIFRNTPEGVESQTNAKGEAEMIRPHDQDGFHQAR